MSIDGQGHFFAIYYPGLVCFVLYLDKISGERLQDHWSSGYYMLGGNLGSFFYGDISVMANNKLFTMTLNELAMNARERYTYFQYLSKADLLFIDGADIKLI